MNKKPKCESANRQPLICKNANKRQADFRRKIASHVDFLVEYCTTNNALYEEYLLFKKSVLENPGNCKKSDLCLLNDMMYFEKSLEFISESSLFYFINYTYNFLSTDTKDKRLILKHIHMDSVDFLNVQILTAIFKKHDKKQYCILFLLNKIRQNRGILNIHD